MFPALTMSTPAGPSQISGSNQLYDILYLENDSTNFQTWKYWISTVLRLQGLMGIVDSTNKYPYLSKLLIRVQTSQMLMTGITII